MSLSTIFLTLLHYGVLLVASAPVLDSVIAADDSIKVGSCFPALDFKMPASLPKNNTHNWWCDPSTEYAFLGFSYEVTACK